MTKRECAIVMAYTGVCMLKGDDLKYFYDYVSTLMNKPMYSHEIGESADTIKEAAKDDFFELCKTATYDETEVGPTVTVPEPITLADALWCSNCAFYDKYSSLVGWCGFAKRSVSATGDICAGYKKREA